MDDSRQHVDLSELDSDEIAELLADFGIDLSPAELRAAAQFVKRLGSVEAAMAAIEQLNDRKAA